MLDLASEQNCQAESFFVFCFARQERNGTRHAIGMKTVPFSEPVFGRFLTDFNNFGHFWETLAKLSFIFSTYLIEYVSSLTVFVGLSM